MAEKVARLLGSLSKSDLLDLHSLLRQLLGNIVSNPIIQKYRTINLRNKIIEKRLAQRSGAIQFLTHCCGFVYSVNKDMESILVFLEAPDDENIREDVSAEIRLAAAQTFVSPLSVQLAWLDETVDTLVSHHASRYTDGGSSHDNKSCAEYIVQFRLPLGNEKFTAGFFREDTLASLYSFGKTFFVDSDKASEVILKYASNATIIENDANKTLPEAFPTTRVAILLSKAIEEEKAFLKSSEPVVEKEGNMIAGDFEDSTVYRSTQHLRNQEAKERQKVMAAALRKEQKAKEEERARNVAFFKEDRKARAEKDGKGIEDDAGQSVGTGWAGNVRLVGVLNPETEGVSYAMQPAQVEHTGHDHTEEDLLQISNT